MGIRTGKVGAIKIAGTAIGYAVDGTLRIEEDQESVRAIGETWDSMIATGKRWRVTANCNYDPENAVQLALLTAITSGSTTMTALTFYDNASAMFTGSALLSSAEIRKSVGSVDKLAVEFVSNGSIAYT